MLKILQSICLFLTILNIPQIFAKIENSEVTKSFLDFLKTYHKNYTTQEKFAHSFINFKQNYENLLIEKDIFYLSPTYEKGVTKFFDVSKEEFRKIYLNLKPGNITKSKLELPEIKLNKLYSENEIPEIFDWREKGAVGKVKNQYICGSCWTFSTTGNIEGLYFIKYNEMKLFSEQQLIDCDKYDYGCNGGWMENAYKYIIEAEGIETEEDYYYRGFDDECSFNRLLAKAKIKEFQIAKTEDEEEIKKILFEKGPLSIALNAENLQSYKSGILDFASAEDCPAVLNHGVLLVGYGVENGTKYWIVKNSWGADWGEDGYFRMSRGKGTCGVNKYILTAELQ